MVDDQVGLSSWPICDKLGCVARCCMALHSKRCFPHTVDKIAEKLCNSSIKVPQATRDMVTQIMHLIIDNAKEE